MDEDADAALQHAVLHFESHLWPCSLAHVAALKPHGGCAQVIELACAQVTFLHLGPFNVIIEEPAGCDVRK